MKKRIIFLLFVITALSLNGCWMRTIDQMYKQPNRSSEYSNLQVVIDKAMQGMEYASPMSGENQQTVQMADLNGDGQDECLVFAKNTSDKILYILIFERDESGDYVPKDRIECNGSGFEQVEYVDVDGRPGSDIVVGRRLNNQIMAIASVFSLADGHPEQILSTVYSKCLTLDIDRDGRHDLFVIREGEGDKQNASAMIYSYRDEIVQRSMEAELSERASRIRRMTVSKLHSGEPAVFVSSSFSESTIVTDVFAIKDDAFVNLTFSLDSQMSLQTLRRNYLYSEDLDEDGILEMPSLVSMKSVSSNPSEDEEEQFLIRWYSMDINGKEHTKLYTYHDFQNSWYVMLDKDLAYRVSVEKKGNDCFFYIWNEDFTEAASVFSVYTLTGKDRDTQAEKMNHFALYRGDSVIYSGGLGMSASQYEITEDSLLKSFHLIRQAWNNGEA